MKKALLFVGGIFTALFSVLHLSFFAGWNSEIKLLSPSNQGIIQALNIGSMYFLLFSAIITFVIAKRGITGIIDKMVLLLVTGYYIVRIIAGFPLFGVFANEIVIQVICLLVACCYIVPIISKNKQN